MYFERMVGFAWVLILRILTLKLVNGRYSRTGQSLAIEEFEMERLL